MSDQIRMVRALGRASDEKQVMSPKQQEDVCFEAFSLYKKVRPSWRTAEWGGFFFDEATVRTTKVAQREVGSLVLAATKPGDCIMAAKFDRLFANVIDACEVIELVNQKQFFLSILDLDIDLSTALGQAVFKIMAAIKELEVKEIRQRAVDSAAYRRKFGLPNNSHAPIGWRIVDNETGDGRIYLPDQGQRNIAKKLLAMRERDEYKFLNTVKFTTVVNRSGLRHPSGNIWTRPCLNRWLRAAREDFPRCVHDMDSSPEAVALSSVGCDDALA